MLSPELYKSQEHYVIWNCWKINLDVATLKNCLMADERWIVREVKNVHKVNAHILAKLASEFICIRIAPQTVRKTIKKHNLYAKSNWKRLYISKKNRLASLEIAKIQINWACKLLDEYYIWWRIEVQSFLIY